MLTESSVHDTKIIHHEGRYVSEAKLQRTRRENGKNLKSIFVASLHFIASFVASHDFVPFFVVHTLFLGYCLGTQD